MKKKILLVLAIVAALICTLAISASAASYDTSRTVTLDDGTVCQLYDGEGNALTYYLDGSTLKSIKTADILNLGTAKIDGISYITFNFKTVSAGDMVVVNFQDEKLGDLQVFNAKFQDSTKIEYCYMPSCLERLSQNYDSANVFRKTTKLKYVEFPTDCELNFIGKYSFSYASALKEIFIPENLTTFPEGSGNDWGCFISCTSLEKVTFAPNSKLKTIPSMTFANCTSLREIKIPDSVETVGVYAFKSNAFVDGPFSPDSRCTYIDKWAFAYCANLVSINIPKNATFNTTANPEGVGLFQQCTSLTTVNFHKDSINTLYPAYMFNGCTALTYIKLPNSLTQLPVRLFNGCKNLETIVFGANVVGMNGMRSLSDHNSFTFGCDSLKYVYLPKTLNIDAQNHSNACHAFFSGGNITFFIDGDYDDALALQNSFKNNVTTCGNNQKITGAEIISLEEYNKLAEVKKCYLVWGGNTCNMFYDDTHEIDNNPCVVNCDRCKVYGVAEKNPVHSELLAITYESFALAGKSITTCANEGCLHHIEDAAAALFVSLGYSIPENGRGALTIGYLVNNDAISAYEKANDVSLRFGGFAVLKDKIGEQDIFNSDGKTADGVISAEISEFGVTAFELKIVGFETEEHKALKIAMGAFVGVYKNGTAAYSYLQEGAPDKDDRYCFTSYNANI